MVFCVSCCFRRNDQKREKLLDKENVSLNKDRDGVGEENPSQSPLVSSQISSPVPLGMSTVEPPKAPGSLNISGVTYDDGGSIDYGSSVASSKFFDALEHLETSTIGSLVSTCSIYADALEGNEDENTVEL